MAAPAVIGTAGSMAAKLLTNKWFWIILITIVAIIIIRRKWDKFTFKANARLGKQYGNWQEGTITDGRKREIEAMAQDLYRSLASSWEWESTSEIETLLALNDNELEHAARYYEDAITRGKKTMYEDVEEEWLYGTDADEKLEARLSALGLV